MPKKYIYNFYTVHPAKLKNKKQTTVPYKWQEFNIF